MDAITPEEARAYFRRWELLREEEARQLARTPMETKLRQLAALMASRHHFGVDPDREAGVEAVRELPIRGEQLAHAHEGAHHVDAHLDSTRAVEDSGRHDGTVFGEGGGRKSRVAVLLGTGRKMRPVQRLDLEAREAEREITGKPLGIARDLLVGALGGDPVERGEFGIEQHPLTAQHEDDAGDVLNR